MQSGRAGELATFRVDYAVLHKATDGFNERTHLLGCGGSCKVYRAEVYGHVVAIKVFNEEEGQEDWSNKQIEAEIRLLCSVPPMLHRVRDPWPSEVRTSRLIHQIS